MKRNLARNLGWGAALLALACLPALAEENVISKGIDVWTTPADGFTFSNFELEPIPAGFFCEGSQPFTGKIVFRGVPIHTLPRGVLGDADTVIERLDDATFGEGGQAFTRVRFAALQLEGVEPVETDCGLFHVTVALKGEQPITSMRITRLDKIGGYMDTVLAGEVNLTFTPIDGDDLETRVLNQSFRFNPARSAWENRPSAGFRNHERIAVDADWDGEVDRMLRAPSSFAAGVERNSGAAFRTETGLASANCHCNILLSPEPVALERDTLQLEVPDQQTGCLHLHCPRPRPLPTPGPILEEPTPVEVLRSKTGNR